MTTEDRIRQSALSARGPVSWSGEPLLFFGTLRDPDLFGIVIGRPLADFEVSPARVEGAACLRVEGESYPLLFPRAGAAAEAILVSGFTQREINRLRYYETAEYDLFGISATVAGGLRPALVCLALDVLRPSAAPWRLETWQEEVKPRALIEAELAMSYFGRISGAELDARWGDIEREAQTILARRRRG